MTEQQSRRWGLFTEAEIRLLAIGLSGQTDVMLDALSMEPLRIAEGVKDLMSDLYNQMKAEMDRREAPSSVQKPL